ncbi:MAG: DUF4976 domain-containing protein, partial [Planctomycetaceae bacterium]|nr:DUF4976 domain-containing protein [Planctomycetaceae bacterium]
LVEFVDLYPTLCELAGLPVPKKLPGRSLVPLLTDSTAKVKDTAFSQFPRKQNGRDHMGYAMRTERYRYVEWFDAENGTVVARELYDHTNDSDENENIAEYPENASLLEKLSGQLWQSLPRPTFPHPMLTPAAGGELTWHPANGKPLPPSKPAGQPQRVTFRNAGPKMIDLIWVAPDGSQKSYRKLQQNDTFTIGTRPGALWIILDAQRQPLGHFVVEKKPGDVANAVIPQL